MFPRPRPKLVEPQGGGILAEEAQGLAEQAGGIIVIQGRGECLLGELFALGAGHDGDMQITESAVAEAALEVDLARGGIEKVRAADDVSDALGFVIDDDGELVGPKSVGAQ